MGVDLAGLVDADVEKAVLVGFELQPGTAVGDDAGVVCTSSVFVHFILEIDTGAAHDLIHDHAFSTINDEGAPLGHQRQFTDEDLLLLDFTGLFIDQAAGHIHLRRKGCITAFCLFHIVTRALQSVLATDEMQLQLAGVVGNGGEALQLLDQAQIQEPLKAGPLHLHQIGEISGGLGDLNRAAAHAGTGREDERDTTWTNTISATTSLRHSKSGGCPSR